MSWCRFALSATAAVLLAAGLPAQQEKAANTPPIVEITADDHGLRAPDSIPSGWVTLRLKNRSEEPHFVEFGELPEGSDWGDVQRLYAGEIDSAQAWFARIDFVGGLGVVGPGQTARTSLHLPPGTYHLFCFVRDSVGRPHGRFRPGTQVTVTEDSTTAAPPEADVELTLAEYEITTEGQMRRGQQTVAIHFGDRPGYGEPPYLDVHLARLEEGVDAKEVVEWMDRRHTPAPAKFLGGTPAMAPGKTVYLTIDLEPGRYVWVSDASEAKGMVHLFSVP